MGVRIRWTYMYYSKYMFIYWTETYGQIKKRCSVSNPSTWSWYRKERRYLGICKSEQHNTLLFIHKKYKKLKKQCGLYSKKFPQEASLIQDVVVRQRHLYAEKKKVNDIVHRHWKLFFEVNLLIWLEIVTR